ncbi:MAG: hypothetical protein ACLR17_22095 [Enterobacteriaceae bacterium]
MLYQCPIKIDVPEFLSLPAALPQPLFAAGSRSSGGNGGTYAPLMARAPKTFNFFINQPWMRKLSSTSGWWISAARRRR